MRIMVKWFLEDMTYLGEGEETFRPMPGDYKQIGYFDTDGETIARTDNYEVMRVVTRSVSLSRVAKSTDPKRVAPHEILVLVRPIEQPAGLAWRELFAGLEE